MKQFWREILFTFLFGIICVIPYDLSTSLGRNEYTEKYRYVTQHRNEIKTLIIGSSLSETGLNPFVLGDSVYNFGLPGQTLFYDVALMEQLLPTMTNIKTVIYPLHYNLHLVDAAACDTTNQLNQLVFLYYQYMDVDKIESPQQLFYRSALFSGHFNISNCVDTAPYMPLGYRRWDTSLFSNYEEWAGQNPPLQPDTFECIKLLYELADVCHQYHARLIVYTPPFPDDYIAEMTDEGRSNFQKIVCSVNRKIPIEYHDYTDDKDFRDPSLYLNWNHLNHQGATKFAKRIKRDFLL
jgi:hypothetical protein